MTRESFILEQAEQNANGKIRNVIQAYQNREFATAKGCYFDLNQWYLKLCMVARPDHHDVIFKNKLKRPSNIMLQICYGLFFKLITITD